MTVLPASAGTTQSVHSPLAVPEAPTGSTLHIRSRLITVAVSGRVWDAWVSSTWEGSLEEDALGLNDRRKDTGRAADLEQRMV